MLYLSLIVSGVLLLITNVFAWKSKQPVAEILVLLAVFSFVALGLCMVFLPPVLAQAIVLAAIVSVWGMRRWRRSLFLPLSCVATLLVYGVFSVFALQNVEKLRQEFPYESMETRLPPAKIHLPLASLTPARGDRLAALESRLDENGGTGTHRASFLRTLHEDTVQAFVEQPGFGAARMIHMHLLRYGPYRQPPIPQPGQPSPSSWQADSSAKQPYSPVEEDHLLILHEASIVDFVNFEGLGFVKDRWHVAGFQGHQVRELPKAPVDWELQRFDLIGLVVHDKPTAYVSDHLPRMDELRVAPTRPLDDFEAAGLPALERGEELYVRDRGTERRMLGAVRATRQCLDCHGGERGDLLGAFSYRLTRGVTAGR